MAETSIIYNEIDLGDASYELILSESFKSLSPQLSSTLISIPGKDGAYKGESKYPPRSIRFNAFVDGSSNQDVKDKCNNIARVLNQKDVKKLQFDTFTVTEGGIVKPFFWAVLDAPIDSKIVGSSAWLPISFLAADPFAYGDEDNSSTAINADPFTTSRTPYGTHECKPVFIIENTTGGDVVGIALENTTRGEVAVWNGTLPDTKFLFIDSKLQHVSIRDAYDSTSGTPAMTDFEGQFPKMTPGISNTLKVTGDGGFTSGSIRARHRSVYL